VVQILVLVSLLVSCMEELLIGLLLKQELIRIKQVDIIY